MHTIKIGLNTSINPCILTSKGEFCPNNHSLYIMCSPATLLYKKYGWYLGTIWIGNKQLTHISKDIMSEKMNHINNNIERSIHGNLDELGELLYHKINEICNKLHTHFPTIEFKIQNNNICVPELEKVLQAVY
jgi:hypothetical protein